MTLKMTFAQVVETSVSVNNNNSSQFQNYTNPDDHTRQTTINGVAQYISFESLTPRISSDS